MGVLSSVTAAHLQVLYCGSVRYLLYIQYGMRRQLPYDGLRGDMIPSVQCRNAIEIRLDSVFCSDIWMATLK